MAIKAVHHYYWVIISNWFDRSRNFSLCWLLISLGRIRESLVRTASGSSSGVCSNLETRSWREKEQSCLAFCQVVRKWGTNWTESIPQEFHDNFAGKIERLGAKPSYVSRVISRANENTAKWQIVESSSAAHLLGGGWRKYFVAPRAQIAARVFRFAQHRERDDPFSISCALSLRVQKQIRYRFGLRRPRRSRVERKILHTGLCTRNSKHWNPCFTYSFYVEWPPSEFWYEFMAPSIA